MSLVPSIEREGQEFYDEVDKRGRNVFTNRPRPIALAVTSLFGSKSPEVISGRFNRIPLRWMKPDGKGGLVPRE